MLGKLWNRMSQLILALKMQFSGVMKFIEDTIGKVCPSLPTLMIILLIFVLYKSPLFRSRPSERSGGRNSASHTIEMPVVERTPPNSRGVKHDDSASGRMDLLGDSLEAPADSGNFAYAIMFWQGVGQLFPWNAFITAAAYFGSRFCKTDMANDFENYFSISFTCFQTAGLALSVLYGNRFSLHDKIVYPLICYSSLFALTTALVLVEDINGYVLFWLTFLSSSANGLAGAILSAGLFSLGGCLPPKYTAALMSGQGLAGLSVAVAGIVTQAAAPMAPGYCETTSNADDSEGTKCSVYSISYSALSYFLIATIVLGSCAVLFFVLVKLPFTEWHTRLAGVNIYQMDEEKFPNIEQPLLAGLDTPVGRKLPAGMIQSEAFNRLSIDDDDDDDINDGDHFGIEEKGTRVRNPLGTGDGGGNGEDDDIRSPGGITSFKDSRLQSSSGETADAGSVEKSLGIISVSEVMRILSIIKIPAATVFLVFVTTISLFPATIVFLRSEHHCQTGERFFNDLFVPFFFVLFNLGDFLGRLIAGHFSPIFKPTNVWLGGLLRIAYIPLFLLCNVANSQLPVVFAADAWPIFLMITFALSNGYVASTCMQMGPALVPSGDAPLAGTIMIFCLTAGLMGGAAMSFPVTAISQGSVGE